MENLNAKVGTERAGEIFGKFGLGTHDEGGVSWVQWCRDDEQPTPGFKESKTLIEGQEGKRRTKSTT